MMNPLGSTQSLAGSAGELSRNSTESSLRPAPGPGMDILTNSSEQETMNTVNPAALQQAISNLNAPLAGNDRKVVSSPAVENTNWMTLAATPDQFDPAFPVDWL